MILSLEKVPYEERKRSGDSSDESPEHSPHSPKSDLSRSPEPIKK